MEAKTTHRPFYKKILFAMGITLAFLLIVLTVSAFADTTDTTPKLEIYAKNLELNNSVNLVFAVRADGLARSDVKLLLWTAPRSDAYTVGTQQSTLSSNQTLMIGDVECYIYTYSEFAAKNMADDVYIMAYSQSTGTCSEIDKYSVLQYAHNKSGASAKTSSGADLDEVIVSMLQYGAASQKYFNYRTDRLANAEYRLISVTDGYFASDLSHEGLYQTGTSVTLQAYQTDTAGLPFSHWKNSAGEKISEDITCTITIGESNENYTAVYQSKETYLITVSGGTIADTELSNGNYPKDAVITITAPETTTVKFRQNPATAAFAYWTNSSGEIISESRNVNITVTDTNETYTANYSYAYEYFDFVLLEDGTYAVKRSDSITLKPSSTVIIPSFYNNIAVTKIAEYSNINATGVYIPHSITEISDYAFQNCDKLNRITISSSIQSIGAYVFQNCSNLSSVSFEIIDGWHYESEGEYYPIVDDLSSPETNPNFFYQNADDRLYLIRENK